MNEFFPPREPGTEQPTFTYRDRPSPTASSTASVQRANQQLAAFDGDVEDEAPPPPPPPPQPADPSGPPQFPAPLQDGSPRVWFMTSADSPIPLACALKLVEHGDSVIAGIDTRAESVGTRLACREQLEVLARDTASHHEGARDGRCVLVDLDPKSSASVQAAFARGAAAFGKIDILYVGTTLALVGTVEELAQTPQTQSLVADCFRTNFFASVNVIKSIIPYMRETGSGHIVLLTGITGHLGTPGLGAYCASQWAIEGYCDSLAYEVAPFGIKVSIVQSNIEISLLTNRVTSAPAMAQYGIGSWKQTEDDGDDAQPPRTNRAPLARGWLSSLLERLESAAGGKSSSQNLLSSSASADFYPVMPEGFPESLIAETIYSILSIGGHENPPARHIVGLEGVASVKEKLKTVSEELEDFVGVSGQVDL